MPDFKYSAYFEREVLRKRSYLRHEWRHFAVINRVKVEEQQDGRFRFWASIPAVGGRYLRVVTLEDRVTIHNAFFDRRFVP